MTESRHYSIKHTTRYQYSGPVTESISEIWMQPLSDERQTCRSFELTLTPRARVTAYGDHLGNLVHHFDIPAAHTQLVIGAKSTVEVRPAPELPAQLPESAWQELDRCRENASEAFYDYLLPSRFAAPSDLLFAFAREQGIERGGDPLSLLREINEKIYNLFEYAPQATRVDSPIDHALMCRCGVCQDYSHVMITLAREVLGIPARYVSGYLFHRTDTQDRSACDATHAWIETWLPGLGWIGFDPTNNLEAGERHIRVAYGRDYDDVPPTRGVFKGGASSDLSVAVQVSQTDSHDFDLKPVPVSHWSSPPRPPQPPTIQSRLEALQQQQQQQ